MPDLIQIDDPGDAGAIRPALRPLEVSALEEEGEAMILLADPLHLLEDAIALPSAYLPFLQILDGSRTLDQLCSELVQETGDLQLGGFLRSLVAKLDEHLLLDSPRFREAWARHVAEYRDLPARPAALAGISYPEEGAELEAFMSELRRQAQEFPPAAPAPGAAGPPAALVSPHIDLRRGGGAMARAYMEWEGLESGAPGSPAGVVAAFGTGHSVLGSLIVPTAKDFETPLGTVPVARELVRELGARLGQEIFTEEIAHRDEHSLEFQAVFLADLARRGARFELLPMLCGSFHPYLSEGAHPRDDETVEELVTALREVLREARRPVRFVAGVDFSHVGRRFGDPWDLTEDNLKELEAADRRLIETALTGEPDAWFEAIAARLDSTHICGFAPVYLMLRTMGGARGRLLHYEQSPEPESESVVTYASIAYEAPLKWLNGE